MRVPVGRSPLSERDWSAVEFDPDTGHVVLLDQRVLPERVEYVRCKTIDDVANGIRSLTVRGAPAIGITAAYGIALIARQERGDARTFLMTCGIAGRGLAATRPTAVNLSWAVGRMSRCVADASKLDPEARANAVLEEAERIHRDDVASCKRIGELGSRDIPDGATVLTHCNTGGLATGGYGTALGVVRAAVAAGKNIRVIATETRPFLQGARLTAWELAADDVPVQVVTDGMVAHLMQRGRIQFAVVGADRIAKNGDVANKIGTYAIALAANAHSVPFTVAAPWSTIDLSTPTGQDIPIEERASDEVAVIGGVRFVPTNVHCLHPAFDVTPNRLIAAIYTERGTFDPR